MKNQFQDAAGTDAHALRPRRLGIDTYQEPVVYLREDSHVCKSEGFESQSRVELRWDDKHMVATLNVVTPRGFGALAADEVGLSEAAWRISGGCGSGTVHLAHPAPVESFAQVRAKIFGHAFSTEALRDIVADIRAGHYSTVEMASFLTACAGGSMGISETVALTRAMVAEGTRLRWPQQRILDKHCIGGIPGNRTTLIVVPIVAALGLTIPKTSSRAITSPSGTADTMETLAPVALDVASMRKVVEAEGGCIIWGGSVNLSPVDDILIRVERPLDLDSEAQMIASVISKKVAAGSTYALIDIPVGPTAKIRSEAAANALAAHLVEVGRTLGLDVEVAITDGTQPVGRGIGPALEARDVLAVLRNEPQAPADLRERALDLAGRILEHAGGAAPGHGTALARAVLDDGRAWRKFQAIALAQGGLREPVVARQYHVIEADAAGTVARIDNRRLARIAKLAGAPRAPGAGVDLLAAVGSCVQARQPLYAVHAESPGELAYALDYARRQAGVIEMAPT